MLLFDWLVGLLKSASSRLTIKHDTLKLIDNSQLDEVSGCLGHLPFRISMFCVTIFREGKCSLEPDQAHDIELLGK